MFGMPWRTISTSHDALALPPQLNGTSATRPFEPG